MSDHGQTVPARSAKRATSAARLGSILGFEIDIDRSWLVIFFLVFWSLSQAVFPQAAPDLPGGIHVAMGFVGTFLFFASLLAHELSHAVVSRAKSIPIEGFTLFIFGGIARTTREPDTPMDEILIAGVGPVASLVLAGLFWATAVVSTGLGAGEAVVAVAQYLAVINFALAVFNMLPGFPLDGGRVFRAVVWRITGDRTRATRWATDAGRLLGTFLMVLGAIQALAGAPLQGLWLAFIGWFLRGLARMSFQQHVLHDLLGDYAAADLMTPDPELVSVRMPLEELVEDRFLKLRYGGYPVEDDGRLVGLVTLEAVKPLPRGRWGGVTVADVMSPVTECAVLPPGAAVTDVLRAISSPSAGGRVLVVEEGRLIGIISASDVARWMQRAQWIRSLTRRGT